MKSIIKKVSTGIAALAMLLGISFSVAPLLYAASPAIDVINNSCTTTDQNGSPISVDSEFCKGQSDDLFAPGGLFTKIINALLFVIGAIAVVMIVIGGFRYVVSGGDSSQVTGAKNTIMYAIIGLVVALLAYAIVNFVIAQF